MRPLLTVESVIPRRRRAPRGGARARPPPRERRGGADPRALGPTSSRTGAFWASRAGADPVRSSRSRRQTASPCPRRRRCTRCGIPRSRRPQGIRRDAHGRRALAEGKHRFDDVMRPLPPRALPCRSSPSALGLLALAFHWSSARAQPGSRAAPRVVVGVPLRPPRGARDPPPGDRAAGDRRGDLALRRHATTMRFVGFANFVDILTARGAVRMLASGSFYLVLLVTLLWTVVQHRLPRRHRRCAGAPALAADAATFARSTACCSSCRGPCRATSPRSRGRACSTASSARHRPDPRHQPPLRHQRRADRLVLALLDGASSPTSPPTSGSASRS